MYNVWVTPIFDFPGKASKPANEIFRNLASVHFPIDFYKQLMILLRTKAEGANTHNLCFGVKIRQTNAYT